jgi:hypothetical protein
MVKPPQRPKAAGKRRQFPGGVDFVERFASRLSFFPEAKQGASGANKGKCPGGAKLSLPTGAIAVARWHRKKTIHIYLQFKIIIK